MPEILLPTASKQNAIHEDVKQLKESSGAGKKYKTRILTGSGDFEVELKGLLHSISVGNYTADLKQFKSIKIDGVDILENGFTIGKASSEVLFLNIEVREGIKISGEHVLGYRVVCKVEVPE